MRRIFLTILTFCILSLSAGYCAETKSPIKQSTVQSKSIKNTTSTVLSKDYTVQKLPTGQTVIVMPVKTNPIVTIDTWIKTGSVNENDQNSGVAHFLEHLFFKGTEKTPPGAFDRILESKGGVTNAATSKDFTHYYITIPAKEFDKALELHADMLLNPLIPRKELEKERLVVLEEISKGKDSPTNIMYNNLFRVIYTQSEPYHPYFRPVIGSNKVIETISRDEILDFYNKWYSPQNMTTVIVGDIDPDYAIKKVAEFFVNNNKTFEEGIYPKAPTIQKQLRISEEKDITTGYMAIAYKAPKFKDDKDGYALDVLSTILGDSRSSILNQKLKEQKQLVYSISASNSTFMDDGLFVVQASLKPENLNKAEEEIFKEIDLIKKGGITDAQVAKAINMIKTSTYYSRESISNISNELGYLTLFWGNTWYYDNYLNNIEKVKKADVIRVAKKYLDKNKSAISTVMPKTKDSNTKEISDVNKIPQTPAQKLESANNIDKYKLSNGSVLIIKKNPANSIIAMDIQAVGGNFIEKTPGIATITASSATKGTKKMESDELAKFLDEKGIKLSLSSGNDTFDISLLTTTNELDSALSILNDVINEPAFSNYEIEKVKKLKLASIKQMKDSALNLAVDKFKSIAFKGSIYGNNSTVLEKNIPNVTKEEIIEYYNKVLEPKNLLITVVGNVDDKKIIDAMTNIFKDKKQKEIRLKDIKTANFIPEENINETVIKDDTKTAWVLIGFKTDNIYNEKDLAALKVINAILGEGMSSRLFKNLRDNQGLAYSVGSTLLQNAGDGAYVAYIGTNNKNIETAKKGMLREICRLKTEYVTGQELQEAKDKILGNILISLETNMDDANLLGWHGALGYNINHLEEYKNAILNVTQSDILAVANKYFSNPYINVTVKDNTPLTSQKSFNSDTKITEDKKSVDEADK